jgi:hypothetical protein
MTDEFIFKVFFDEESVDLCEQIVYFLDLKTELDRYFDSNFINREVVLI